MQSLPDALSDAELLHATAHAIAQPKRARASSFTLHAPLELLARAALLPLVPPETRTLARLRLAAIATEYAEGEEIAPPTRAFPNTTAALAALVAAFADADADAADAAITWLAPRLPARDLSAALADAAASRLGAAAHAPILLSQLPAASAQFGDLSGLLRAPVRTLAAEAHVRLTWVDTPDPAKATSKGPADLFEALAAPARIRASSAFIAPTMLAVEADGFAAHTLARACATASPADAGRGLLRIAALSMLQDDPAHAPYGWSHCLSLPQGVLGLAPHARDPGRCVRVAATYVLGFRATLGQARLNADWRTAAPEPQTVTELAARAAAHPDAHLAKYTVACLAAAADDPPARPLFMAAATYLGRWWDAHPGAGSKG